MAKSHGRNGLIYMGTTTAVAVAFTRSEDLNLATDFADATSQGDTFKSSLPGLSDWKLKLSKWFDAAYWEMYDGVINQRVFKTYFYPDRNATGNYFYGTCYIGLDSLKTDVGSVAEESWTVVAATSMTLIHT